MKASVKLAGREEPTSDYGCETHTVAQTHTHPLYHSSCAGHISGKDGRGGGGKTEEWPNQRTHDRTSRPSNHLTSTPPPEMDGERLVAAHHPGRMGVCAAMQASTCTVSNIYSIVQYSTLGGVYILVERMAAAAVAAALHRTEILQGSPHRPQ